MRRGRHLLATRTRTHLTHLTRANDAKPAKMSIVSIKWPLSSVSGFAFPPTRARAPLVSDLNVDLLQT